MVIKQVCKLIIQELIQVGCQCGHVIIAQPSCKEMVSAVKKAEGRNDIVQRDEILF